MSSVFAITQTLESVISSRLVSSRLASSRLVSRRLVSSPISEMGETRQDCEHKSQVCEHENGYCSKRLLLTILFLAHNLVSSRLILRRLVSSCVLSSRLASSCLVSLLLKTLAFTSLLKLKEQLFSTYPSACIDE